MLRGALRVERLYDGGMTLSGNASTHSKVRDALGDQVIEPAIRAALLAMATSFDDMLFAVSVQLNKSEKALERSQRALYAILTAVIVAMIVNALAV